MNNQQIMSNPRAKNILDLYKKGDTQGLINLAENMCKTNGTTFDNVKNQFEKMTGFRF